MIITADAKYKRNCENCYWGSCGNIINNEIICFCRHVWGETALEKINISNQGPIFIIDEIKRQRQSGVLRENLAEEIACPNHKWDILHPAKQDHQLNLFEEAR